MLALVTDCGPEPSARLAQIRAALRGGVDWVQLRDREAEPAALLHFADRVREVCTDGTRLLINRRLDVALACGADGVHLGGDALAVADARACWASAGATGMPILGVSTHSADEAAAAVRAGADYVHLAPIYPPLSKPVEREPLGVEPIAELGRRGVAVIAQGGIEVDRVEPVVGAGAKGVAVTGAILGAADCEAAARALRSALDRCAGNP